MEWIVCDNCGNTERRSAAAFSGLEWFTVGNPIGNIEPLHFCKAECLREYADLVVQGKPFPLAEPQHVIDRMQERTAGRVR